MRRGMHARRPLMAMALIGAAILIAQTRVLGEGIQGRIDEYRVKAALLVKFTQFVQWAHESPIVVCTIGDAPGLQDALARQAKQFSVVDRSVSLPEDMSQCDILFISAAVGRDTPDVLARVGRRAVLTIGETDPFIKEGGIARFYTEDNRIRFHIDARASENHGLKISSQLLSLGAR